MGHKVHPTGIRLGIAKDWNSKWFAGKREYAQYLAADLKVREMLKQRLAQAGISKILIERPAKTARVTIHTARPGVVIGKKGEDIEHLKTSLQKILGGQVHVNIEEIRKPETDAQLIADSIAQQLEKRIMFRRAMKRAMQNAMRLGAQGIKIMSSGRLNGAEIARREWYREGRVPLHTLRADIDYGTAEANTTYGKIGIKVWVYKGDMVAKQDVAVATPEAGAEEARRGRKTPSRATEPGDNKPAVRHGERKPGVRAEPAAQAAKEEPAAAKAPVKRVRKTAVPGQEAATKEAKES